MYADIDFSNTKLNYEQDKSGR